MTQTMRDSQRSVELLGTDDSDLQFREALADLFTGDGTIYLVSGYFTYLGYRSIRPDIAAFLERSRDNELVVIVGPASDQFSARIAYDLWKLDEYDQVQIYKRSRGLHAKLYLRDGPNPRCIIGSGNITQVAFEYNVELNVDVRRPSSDHPDIEQFLGWLEEMIDAAEPLRRRDILGPMQIASSFVNWSNKARLLPMRNVALRVIPILLLILVLGAGLRFI